MKRYFAPLYTVFVVMTFVTTIASAQKIALPGLNKGPMPAAGELFRRLHGKGKLQMPLMGNLPQASLGKLMGNNPYAWMIHLNNQGNQAVTKMFQNCISHPGACNGLASQSSLETAIQGVQTQSVINSQHQQVNQSIQTHAIGQTNCAVTGGTVYWNSTTQRNECSH